MWDHRLKHWIVNRNYQRKKISLLKAQSVLLIFGDVISEIHLDAFNQKYQKLFQEIVDAIPKYKSLEKITLDYLPERQLNGFLKPLAKVKSISLWSNHLGDETPLLSEVFPK